MAKLFKSLSFVPQGTKRTININGRTCYLHLREVPGAPLCLQIIATDVNDSNIWGCLTCDLGDDKKPDENGYVSDVSLLELGETYLNVPKCSNLVSILEENALGGLGCDDRGRNAANRVVQTAESTASYPVFQFDLQVLREFDEEGVDAYMKRYCRVRSAGDVGFSLDLPNILTKDEYDSIMKD